MSDLIVKAGSDGKYRCHESAYIDEGAQIGKGTTIWHYSHVMGAAKIGQNCTIGQNCFIGDNAEIGDGVKIQNNVSVYESVVIEDDVFCGPSCVFTNVINPRAFIERKDEYQRTIVRKGATIGANATIICGNKIGKYAFIGAGAVINEDVKDFALMVEVPARQIGWMCKCGEKLPENYICEKCKNAYQKSNQKIDLVK